MPLSRRLTMMILAALCQACSVTSHQVAPSSLGRPVDFAAMERLIDEAGPVEVTTVNSADWQVPLSGLLNLESPSARAAHLTDRPEPIHVFAHVVRHPQFGAYLVDTGVSQQLLDDPGAHGVHWVMRQFFPLDKMVMRQGTAQILSTMPGGIRGVFFTHLHVDHISGMPDVPASVPLYVAPTEATSGSFQNLFVRSPTDGLLQGKAPLQQWPFPLDAAGKALPLGEVVDIFGDASAFAISVPGHTPGSTAYLLRTPQGAVLLTGDVCHTRWGWEHGVEPGTFTADQAANRKSLALLQDLARRHPRMQVRLGHQD